MSLLDLEEAKRPILNPSAGAPRWEDEDIQADIDTAEAIIASFVGPLTPTVVSGWVDVSDYGGTLPYGPYIGPVTSVSNYSTPTYSGDLSALIINDSMIFGLPRGRWWVTYTAGWTTVPAPLRTACLEMFKHVFAFRRGNTQALPPGTTQHAIPWRVSELIEPYRWAGSRL